MAYSKKLASTYNSNRNHYRSTDKKMAPLLKKIGVKGKTILDFGCGNGSDAEKFIQAEAKYVFGTDSSAAMITSAKERKIQNTTFIKTNGKNLPLKHRQFDFVFSSFVLHYLKDIPSQFKEIARVLKPGGDFVAVFQHLTNNDRLINKRVPIILGNGTFTTNIIIFSKSLQEIECALKKSKIKIVKLITLTNPDSKINPTYRNKYKFNNKTSILWARK